MQALGPRPAREGRATGWAWRGLTHRGEPAPPGLYVLRATLADAARNLVRQSRSCWVGHLAGGALPRRPAPGDQVGVALRLPGGAPVPSDARVYLALYERAGTPGRNVGPVLGERVGLDALGPGRPDARRRAVRRRPGRPLAGGRRRGRARPDPARGDAVSALEAVRDAGAVLAAVGVVAVLDPIPRLPGRPAVRRAAGLVAAVAGAVVMLGTLAPGDAIVDRLASPPGALAALAGAGGPRGAGRRRRARGPAPRLDLVRAARAGAAGARAGGDRRRGRAPAGAAVRRDRPGPAGLGDRPPARRDRGAGGPAHAARPAAGRVRGLPAALDALERGHPRGGREGDLLLRAVRPALPAGGGVVAAGEGGHRRGRRAGRGHDRAGAAGRGARALPVREPGTSSGT